jgi:hypothetical protein
MWLLSNDANSSDQWPPLQRTELNMPRANLVTSPAARHPHSDDAADAGRPARADTAFGPAAHRKSSVWRYVAKQVEKAAGGGDVADAAVALRLALILEKVECRPQ